MTRPPVWHAIETHFARFSSRSSTPATTAWSFATGNPTLLHFLDRLHSPRYLRLDHGALPLGRGQWEIVLEQAAQHLRLDSIELQVLEEVHEDQPRPLLCPDSPVWKASGTVQTTAFAASTNRLLYATLFGKPGLYPASLRMTLCGSAPIHRTSLRAIPRRRERAISKDLVTLYCIRTYVLFFQNMQPYQLYRGLVPP